MDPELLENLRLRPLLEAPVCRGMVADARPIQSAPLAAGARHKENGVHGIASRHGRIVAAQRVRLPRRQKLLHLGPKLIRNTPTVVFDYKAHKKCSPFPPKTSPAFPNFQTLLR